MKRDMELVRSILLKLWENDDPSGWTEIEFEDVDSVVISYHIKIMAQAGLIEAHDFSSVAGFEWKPFQITWAGQDFIESARNENIWNQAKGKMSELGDAVSFDVILLLLKTLIKQKLGLETD